MHMKEKVVLLFRLLLFVCSDKGEQIEWHWPLSGVHSIMMVNSAQPGEGVGAARPSPLSLYLPSIAKLWCFLQLRGQTNSSYFSSTLFSSVG
jgi:hypothetical protein